MSNKIIVKVRTATIIAANRANPHLILVGKSAKHGGRFVLPGGKVEFDLNGNVEEDAECAKRELEEETKLVIGDIDRIGTATDPDRDIRTVPYSKVFRAHTEPSLTQLSLPPDTLIEAHYGVPDAIFLGYYDYYNVEDTNLELSERVEFNIYDVKPELFGAGHDVVVLWYRWLMSTGAHALRSDALRDFSADRRGLTAYFSVVS